MNLKKLTVFLSLILLSACRPVVSPEVAPLKIIGGRYRLEQTLIFEFYSQGIKATYTINEKIIYRVESLRKESSSAEAVVLEDLISLEKTSPFLQSLFGPKGSKNVKAELFESIPFQLTFGHGGEIRNIISADRADKNLRRFPDELAFKNAESNFMKSTLGPLIRYHRAVLEPLKRMSVGRGKEIAFDFSSVFVGSGLKPIYRWEKVPDSDRKALKLSEAGPGKYSFDVPAEGLLINFPLSGTVKLNDPKISAAFIPLNREVREAELHYRTGPVVIGDDGAAEGFNSIDVSLRMGIDEERR